MSGRWKEKHTKVPFEPAMLDEQPVESLQPELDPSRAMREETRQLFEKSRSIVEKLIQIRPPRRSIYGREGIVEIPSIDLTFFPTEIGDFLQFEHDRVKNPIFMIRGIQYKFAHKRYVDCRALDLIVRRDGDVGDTKRTWSYVRVTMTPDDVEIGAWSSEDPISSRGLDIIRHVRECVYGETKAERDIANFTVASGIVDFITTFTG